jgi:hypothetical protein
MWRISIVLTAALWLLWLLWLLQRPHPRKKKEWVREKIMF